MNEYPKITYRSDSTMCRYKMFILAGVFRIEVWHLEGHFTTQSELYKVEFPWRLTINRFFDIVTAHINTGEWMP